MNGGVSHDTLERAKTVAATYRVQPGLYVLGSLERGLTVYNQQLRAHNLVWALWEIDKPEKTRTIRRVAIVGGGIAGLTTAACFLSLFKDISVTVFEQRWDLCPLQQGSDNRWLHPRIYDWPSPGSRAPGASLPVLNWSEGRASDVARTVLGEFSRFASSFDQAQERLTVLLGLRYFRITGADSRIDWIANRGQRAGDFYHIGKPEGSSDSFDTIVLAAGFGLETQSSVYPTTSYWRNEQLGQPLLNGGRQNFLVSGFGDGALIDLCRLTIERYRQDTILYELFPGSLEQFEDKLATSWSDPEQDAFPFFTGLDGDPHFLQARIELSKRIRKDTRVTLHISGEKQSVKAFSGIFGPRSSFMNRMITYLLYRCGAFAISVSDLKTTAEQYSIPEDHVLCRYGAKPLEHLLALFTDGDKMEKRLKEMKMLQKQSPQRLWHPGTFPYPSK